MLLPLLLYYWLLNNPHGAILCKGYFFSKSVSAPVSVPEVFPSFFFYFRGVYLSCMCHGANCMQANGAEGRKNDRLKKEEKEEI